MYELLISQKNKIFYISFTFFPRFNIFDFGQVIKNKWMLVYDLRGYKLAKVTESRYSVLTKPILVIVKIKFGIILIYCIF